MMKFTRTLVLMAALGGLATSTVSTAQEKKKADEKKPADKKAPEKKAEEKASGSIDIYQGKNGWRYSIKSSEGKTIAMPLPSASWETKEECLKAIADLKAILNTAKPAERKEEK
jgi:uncharacterized protein YegP (UPF0339 family)